MRMLNEQLLNRLYQSPTARALGDPLLTALLEAARTSDYNTAYPSSPLGRAEAMDALKRLNSALEEAFNMVPGVDVPDPVTGRHKYEDDGHHSCRVCGETDEANPSHRTPTPKPTTLEERIEKHRDHWTTVTNVGVVCSTCNEYVELEPDADMFGGFAPDEDEREMRAGLAAKLQGVVRLTLNTTVAGAILDRLRDNQAVAERECADVKARPNARSRNISSHEVSVVVETSIATEYARALEAAVYV